MPTFRKGDVVRVPFPYTDRPTRQWRPALVVSDGGLGDAGGFLWVVMITSAENRPWPGDVPFGAEYAASGLPAPSVIRSSKIATIELGQAEVIGHAPSDVLDAVDSVIANGLAMTRGNAT
jgi:mRNA interferase MazF